MVAFADAEAPAAQQGSKAGDASKTGKKASALELSQVMQPVAQLVHCSLTHMSCTWHGWHVLSNQRPRLDLFLF